MERIPLNHDQDAICSVQPLLGIRTVMAMHHWQGNPSYTYQDIVRDMPRHGESPRGSPPDDDHDAARHGVSPTTQLWR